MGRSRTKWIRDMGAVVLVGRVHDHYGGPRRNIRRAAGEQPGQSHAAVGHPQSVCVALCHGLYWRGAGQEYRACLGAGAGCR